MRSKGELTSPGGEGGGRFDVTPSRNCSASPRRRGTPRRASQNTPGSPFEPEEKEGGQRKKKQRKQEKNNQEVKTDKESDDEKTDEENEKRTGEKTSPGGERSGRKRKFDVTPTRNYSASPRRRGTPRGASQNIPGSPFKPEERKGGEHKEKQRKGEKNHLEVETDKESDVEKTDEENEKKTGRGTPRSASQEIPGSPFGTGRSRS